MASPSLILDCGANVGYASAFFLSRFPEAEVIAIEPDADNFAMLERNLAPYGSRARAVQAGVWSHPTSLRVVEAPDGEAGAWAFQVRESPTGGPDTVPGVSIGDLLARSGHSRISLLKMDIEGAEAVVFARGADEWLPSVDDIIIELHDDTAFGPATEAFLRAIADHDFEVSHPRELTYCRRRGRTASS